MGWVTDSAFRIGASHKVCEDYAAHSDDVAVLSDGCSSASRTDLGARILCMNELLTAQLPMSALVSYAAMIGIESSSLCATRLSIRKRPLGIHSRIEGDGYLVIKFNDGSPLFVMKVEYQDNTPWYPFYVTLPGVEDNFSADKCQPIVLSEGLASSGVFVGNMVTSRGLYVKVDESIVSMVAVCSDGLGTFTDHDGQKVPETTIADQLCDLKTTGTGCVSRRVQSLARTEWRDWRHDDDFSIAAVVRNDL